MKLWRRAAMASVATLLFGGQAPAQEKAGAPLSGMIPVKVEIVLGEYDGATRISSLPYTVETQAAASANVHVTPAQLRLGVRVPVQRGDAAQGHSQWEYMDIGTNIDCSARSAGDGTYEINLTVERSSVYLEGTGGQAGGLRVATSEPIVRQFRESSTLLLKDGQSDESTAASDPFSGHQMRVTVTLHVVK
ncbi:MAG TPA: hypothetical protein VGS20_13040 [Candidatus Acidoferrales bacterium]|nr:hypothetical protein [Candidatus Acidoferrales bacterium]